MLRQTPAFQISNRSSTRSSTQSLRGPPQPFGCRSIALAGNLVLSFWGPAARPGLQSDRPPLFLGSRVTTGEPLMFSFFGKKPDYEAIFVSDDATQKLIYGDRAKTSKVLGDEAFVASWLASRHMSRVSNLIRREALNRLLKYLPSDKLLSHLSRALTDARSGRIQRAVVHREAAGCLCSTGSPTAPGSRNDQ